MAVSRKPPSGTAGPLGWLKKNLFNSPLNGLISVVTLALVVWVAFGLIRWIFLGAEWQQVWINFRLFAVYRYPGDLLWRPLAVSALTMFLLGMTAGVSRTGLGEIWRGVFWWIFALVMVLTIVALFYWESVRLLWLMVSIASLVGYIAGELQPRLARYLSWLWGALPLVAWLLLYGVVGDDDSPLTIVETGRWGGFMLTLILSAVGIALSFPLGILLALGRRSKLPAIQWFCVGFIEIIRGAPLITWLFIASLMVPLLLGIDTESIDALTKALVAITLFSAAYMAENVRGGLQGVPGGQSEAARALGLSAWQNTRLIVLPQALRSVIPAIVGQCIALFKDTSLVFIVGLFDFLEIADIVAGQPASRLVPGGIRLELSLFLAVGYWYFAYRMSVASRQLERHLGLGTR